MTDERIKEEFEKTDFGVVRGSVSFSNPYSEVAKGNRAIGFYSGFRAAERLAKIEVLEDMSCMMDKLRFFSVADYKDAKDRIDTMIAELKEAGE